MGGGELGLGTKKLHPARSSSVLVGMTRAREQGGPEASRHFQLSDGTAQAGSSSLRTAREFHEGSGAGCRAMRPWDLGCRRTAKKSLTRTTPLCK